MSEIFQITKGPFAGTGLDTSKLIPWRYASGQPVLIDGRQRMEWGVDYLTPIFLNVFDPTFGWCTTIDTEIFAGVNLVDHQNPLVVDGKTVTNSYGGDVPSLVQVLKVTATLSNPEGKLVHQTSVLQGINNLGSADLGVKRATLQLYKAMGLPTSPESGGAPLELDSPPEPQRANPAPTMEERAATTKASIQQVIPVSVSRSESEGVEPEDDGMPLALPESHSTPATDHGALIATSATQHAEHQRAETPTGAGPRNGHINARILAQVTHFASLVGENVGELADDAAAKKLLVRLRTDLNKRK
ncbi:hypothetical protein [Xanthomonas sacchari]|nr:hypothetical protein [Xanthomonas sacchari]